MAAIRLLHYQPDKTASYRQAMRVRSLSRAWSAIQEFIASDVVVEQVADVCLIAYRPTQWDDSAVADRCIDLVRAHFGSPDDDGGITIVSASDTGPALLRWRRTSDHLPEFVDFLVSHSPWPKQTLGPVELSFSIRFC